ncbi:MAG: hypothetical protein JW829_13215 [Pirellulales bacterium]|nr:hypothetical protein [Pirellulales bacterium]
MTNFLRLIVPYKYESAWVFDDPDVGLIREPFVFGADRILDWLTSGIPNAEHGFLLYFAPGPFPGAQVKIDWVREECEGNWYKLEDPPMEGWLCPALLKYFDEPPKQIYVKAEPKQG